MHTRLLERCPTRARMRFYSPMVIDLGIFVTCRVARRLYPYARVCNVRACARARSETRKMNCARSPFARRRVWNSKIMQYNYLSISSEHRLFAKNACSPTSWSSNRADGPKTYIALRASREGLTYTFVCALGVQPKPSETTDHCDERCRSSVRSAPQWFIRNVVRRWFSSNCRQNSSMSVTVSHAQNMNTSSSQHQPFASQQQTTSNFNLWYVKRFKSVDALVSVHVTSQTIAIVSPCRYVYADRRNGTSRVIVGNLKQYTFSRKAVNRCYFHGRRRRTFSTQHFESIRKQNTVWGPNAHHKSRTLLVSQ